MTRDIVGWSFGCFDGQWIGRGSRCDCLNDFMVMKSSKEGGGVGDDEMITGKGTVLIVVGRRGGGMKLSRWDDDSAGTVPWERDMLILNGGERWSERMVPGERKKIFTSAVSLLDDK
ncbi:aspartate 1-decarboxylase [Sesbania bispinosa]|nr:aspartate 1-decarboxylase [Sesbania bispinosa]